MTTPEYILHRKSQPETNRVLNRVLFPEARSTLEIAKKQLCLKTDPAILELGCGPGVTNMYLSRYVKTKTMIGIDTDRESIRQGQTTAKHLKIKNLSFIRASATDLPLRDALLDFILCQEVIEHVPNPDKLLEESNRVLRNQGKLLITTPTSKLAPLSSDWIETKIHNRPINDEFAGHLFRFDPQSLLDQVKKAGLVVNETEFSNQYIGSFLVAVLTLWKRKRIRTSKTEIQRQKDRSFNISSFPNAFFMIGQTIDFRLFRRSGFGSNIVILSTKSISMERQSSKKK